MSHARAVILSVTAALAVGAAEAQNQGVSRTELEAKLAERDAVIIELQQRLRALETKVASGAEARPEPVPAELVPTLRQPPSVAVDEARAGSVTIDLTAAERALERSLVQDGTLLLPAWNAEFQPSIGYSNSARDFPTLSGGVLGVSTVERNRITASADFRLGLPYDSQFELGLPLNWVDEDVEVFSTASGFVESGGTGGGIGDLHVGFAKTLTREDGWIPDMVGRVTIGTGTGDRTSGGTLLGGGYPSIAGSVSFLKRQDPVVFLGTAGYRTFFEDGGVDPGDEIFLRAGLGLAISPETSMLFTVDNTFSNDFRVNGIEAEGTDTVQAVLNVGVSTILARDLLLSVNAGVGLTRDAPDYSFLISLPYRF